MSTILAGISCFALPPRIGRQDNSKEDSTRTWLRLWLQLCLPTACKESLTMFRGLLGINKDPVGP